MQNKKRERKLVQVLPTTQSALRFVAFEALSIHLNNKSRRSEGTCDNFWWKWRRNRWLSLLWLSPIKAKADMDMNRLSRKNVMEMRRFKHQLEVSCKNRFFRNLMQIFSFNLIGLKKYRGSETVGSEWTVNIIFHLKTTPRFPRTSIHLWALPTV